MQLVPIDKIPKTEDIVLPTDLRKLYKIFLEMDQICKFENGVGLHACQIGLPYNMFIIKHPIEAFLFNCKYTPIDDKKINSFEGCLSVRNINKSFRQFNIERYEKIRVVGKRLIDMNIVEENRVVEGLEAIILQHEIDHSQGITIDQIGKEVSLW